MSRTREEEIFETQEASDSGIAEVKLASHRDSIIQRPNIKEREEISEVKLNADAAFGIFNGKVFAAPKTEYFSLADAVERRAESVMQRFARLRGELDELKFDLDSMVQSEEAVNDNNKHSNNTSVWSVLQQEAMKLSADANGLEQHRAFELMRSGASSHERSLKGLVDSLKDVDIINNTDAATTTPTTAAEHKQQHDAALQLIVLEQRVHQLETLLGGTSNLYDSTGMNMSTSGSGSISNISGGGGVSGVIGGAKSPFPLVESVCRLEERLSLLDAAQLDALRVKCEATRVELDATLTSSNNKTKSATAAAT